MTPEAVEIVAVDGCVLRGQVWSGGREWIVLLHDVGSDEDLDRWRLLVPGLLAAGLSVLAVDLRGHGASDGEWSEGEAIEDVVTTIRYARAGGARFVVVVAAGVSGVDVLRSVEREVVEGVVVLSARMAPYPPNPLSPNLGGKGENLPRGAGIPKLFIVGANDIASRETTDALRRSSIGWAMEVTLPTGEHGTALLHGVWLGHVGEQIRGFVRDRRHLARLAVSAKGARE